MFYERIYLENSYLGSIWSLDGSKHVKHSDTIDLSESSSVSCETVVAEEEKLKPYLTAVTLIQFPNFHPKAGLQSISLGKSIADFCLQKGGDIILEEVRNEKATEK